MSKENKLLIAFTRFMLEHGIECEEDIYQNDKVDEDSLELIEDLFNIVKLTNHTCNCQHNSNPRDNEPCCRCDSRQTNAEIVKVDSLEIIVRMIGNKPYYEVKYREVGKEDYSVGYSSYDLKIVLGFIAEYFEIVENDRKDGLERNENSNS